MTQKYKLPFYLMTIGLVVAVVVIVSLLATGGSGSAESETVATVNNEEISKDQVYDMMYEMVNGDQVVDQLIDMAIVDQKADEANVTVSDEEIEQAVQYEIDNIIKTNFGSQAGLDQYMAQQGMTMEGLKDQIRQAIPMQLKATKIMGDEVAATDEEINAEYEASYAGTIQASHILVKEEENANDILTQLQEGADFAEMAKEHSTDGSAAQGGDLGYFTREKMVAEFSEAAFNLEAGEISGVVESEFGYHIIKVTNVAPTLEEVKGEIQYNLASKNLQEVYAGWLEEIKEEADINKK